MKSLKSIFQEVIKKTDGYSVYPSKGGKKLGTHPTKKDAQKQVAAIEINKAKNEEKVPGGKSSGMTIQQVAEKHKVGVDVIKDQLKKGIKVESEHTGDKKLAAEIALDHLVEDCYYYDKLSKAKLEEEPNEVLDKEFWRAIKKSKPSSTQNSNEKPSTIKKSNIKETIFSFAHAKQEGAPSNAKEKALKFRDTLRSQKYIVMGSNALYFPNFTWAGGKQQFGPTIGLLVGSDTIAVSPLGGEKAGKIFKIGESMIARLIKNGDLEAYRVDI